MKIFIFFIALFASVPSEAFTEDILSCGIINITNTSVTSNQSGCTYLVPDNSLDPDFENIPGSGDCQNKELTHNVASAPDNHSLEGAILPLGLNTITWELRDTSGGGSTLVDTESQTITVNSNVSFAGSTITPAATSCPGNTNGTITISNPPSNNIGHYSIVSLTASFSFSNGNIICSNLDNGTYKITVNDGNCPAVMTGDIVVPDGTGPTPSIGTKTDPSTCGGTGSIPFTGLLNGTLYNISYKFTPIGGTESTVNTSATPSGGTLTIVGAAGNYKDFIFTTAGCSSTAAFNVTLNNPNPDLTPSNVTGNNPANCGENGSITVTGLSNSVSYDIEFSFNGVPITTPITANTSSSGTLTIPSRPVGTYNNFVFKRLGCSSSPAFEVVLSNPSPPNPDNTPTFSNPTTCGGNGSITISGLTNSSSYTVSFKYTPPGGSETTITLNNQTVSGGSITLSRPAGRHRDFIFTLSMCASLPEFDITLFDPDAPSPNSPVVTKQISKVGLTDGEINVSGLLNSTQYTNVTYKRNGATVTIGNKTSDNNGNMLFTGLDDGTYTEFSFTRNGCSGITTGSAVLADPDCSGFNPTASEFVSACAGQSNGVIRVTNLSTGTSPINIVWNGPGSNDGSAMTSLNTFDITGLADSEGAGDYDLTITDDKGCIEPINNIEIQELDQLGVTFSADRTICSNQATASISVNENYLDYDWSSGATGKTVNLAPGTYTVTVEDAAGCTGTGSVTVTQLNPISISLGGGSKLSIVCANDNDGKVVASVTGGSGTYNFAWTGPNGSISDNDNTIDNLVAGTYNLVVTDSEGCTGTFSAVVTTPSSLDVQASVLDASCFGFSNGGITLTVSGGTPNYTYIWSNGATSKDISNVAAGSYTVTVSDANGCSVSLQRSVGQPTAVVATIIPSSPQICIGQSINLVAGGGTSYTWSNGGVAATTTVNPTTTTTFMVTVTDAGTNNCTATNSVQVVVNPLPTPLITATETSGLSNNDFKICDGDQITLTASGGVMYNWNSGAPNPLVISPSVGMQNYTVTVTDNKGCSASASAAVEIFANPTAGINFSLASREQNDPQNITSANSANCGTVTSCQWLINGSNFSTNCEGITPSFSTQGNQNITLRIQNSCGCSDEVTETLAIVPPGSCVINTFSLNNGNSKACVNQPIPLKIENQASINCVANPVQIEVRRNGTLTTSGFTYSPGTEEITFNTIGSYSITNKLRDNCGCTAEGVRFIDIEPAPEIGFATDNVTQSCVGETVNIKFSDFNEGETVIVQDAATGQEISHQADNFNVILNSAGTRTLRIIAVRNATCSSSVTGKVLNINVLPAFKVEDTDKDCDEQGVEFDFTITTSGGDPTKPIVLNVDSLETISDGNTFTIRGLRPTIDYKFTLSKGDICDAIEIEIPAAPCNCTFLPGTPNTLSYFDCEGAVFDIDINEMLNTSLTEFDSETDTLVLVLHDRASGITLGQVYGVYPETQTSISNDFPGFVPNRNYYLSVVGLRKVLFEDANLEDLQLVSNRGPEDCFSIVNGVPFRWVNEPRPEIVSESGETEICANSYDYKLFVANPEDGTTINWEIIEGGGSFKTYGDPNAAYFHFSNTNRDFYIVRATELKTGFDPVSGRSVLCEGFTDILINVRPNTMSPDPSEIILWPGNILASTADESNTCFSWGYILAGTEVPNQGDGKYYYAPTDIEFDQTNRIYFVDTYLCNQEGCVTRIYYNSEGPLPGLNYKEEDNYSFLVSPNPNRGLFRIDLFSHYPNNFTFEVFDVTGRRALKERNQMDQGNNIKEMDLSNFNKGIYFLRIIDNSNNHYSIEKIIIQ